MKRRVILLDEDVRVVRTSELMALLVKHSQKEVAKSLGISESALSRFMKRNEIRRTWAVA